MKSKFLSAFVSIVLLYLASGATAAVFTEDFESGLGDWTLWRNGSTDWSIANPPQAHSGANVAFSGILNSYREQAILSPSLIAGPSDVQIDFYHQYCTYGDGDDRVNFRLSVNDGSWQIVKEYRGSPLGISYPTSILNSLTNTDQYLHETLNLTPYLNPGDSFRVIFYSYGNYNYAAPGWVVDDVAVTGIVPEPAMMGLLGLGGLVVLLKRKRLETGHP
jgi:hypothetical protein